MRAPTTLERAFELARSGTCANVHEIRLRLRAERFDLVEAHLGGPAIGRQLRQLCLQARGAAEAAERPAPKPPMNAA